MIDSPANNIIRIVASAKNPQTGCLYWQGKIFDCALGGGGVVSAVNKQEGDGCTPAGLYGLGVFYYRADKGEAPKTPLKTIALTPDDGWCDEPNDKNYNKHVKLPINASAENLWRDDQCYDLILTTSHNSNPAKANKGSAIFIHVARDGLLPTRGCIALAKPDLIEIVKSINQNTIIRVHLPENKMPNL